MDEERPIKKIYAEVRNMWHGYVVVDTGNNICRNIVRHNFIYNILKSRLKRGVRSWPR